MEPPMIRRRTETALESQSMPPQDPPDPLSSGMQRSYIKVLIVWAVTLAGLYAFQQYFS